jgi:hypothetical protein
MSPRDERERATGEEEGSGHSLLGPLLPCRRQRERNSPLLVATDLAEGDSAGAVAVRLLHSASGGRALAGGLGGELLAGRPATERRKRENGQLAPFLTPWRGSSDEDPKFRASRWTWLLDSLATLQGEDGTRRNMRNMSKIARSAVTDLALESRRSWPPFGGQCRRGGT